MTDIQQWLIVSLVVVVAVSLGMDYFSGLVEAEVTRLSDAISNV